MTTPRVFITRKIPEDGLHKMQAAADVEIWPRKLPPSRELVLEKITQIDGLVCLLTDPIDEAVIAAGAGKLRVISQMAVGYDNIDIAAATANRIPVGHTPGVLTETTADFAFTLMLAGARRVVEGARYVREGQWETWGPTLLMGFDIYNGTLGIIGFGRIGQAMARRAAGFNMRVIYYDPSSDPAVGRSLGAESCSLEQVLREADFLSIHTPLTEDTYHMIDADAFRKMKPSCVLVNTSRGGTVDPRALYEALKSGELAYAALDVTEPEPISMEDPLLTLDNCLIVPHIASSTVRTRNLMASMAADNLIAGLQGEPLPNCVNPEVYSEKGGEQ